jgi:hypothetical protein
MAIEDFTTYTEVDPGDDITIIPTKISWDDLNSRGGGSSYVCRDKGAAYFDGDFSHRFILQRISAVTGATPYHWLLANAVNDFQTMKVADEDMAGIRIYYSGGPSGGIYLNLIEDGEQLQDGWSGSGYPPAGIDYYITVNRDDDGGANSTGQYVARICTVNYYGEPGAILQDTLQLDCSAGEQNDFRYVYGLANVNTGDTYLCDGYTENMTVTDWIRPTGYTDAGGNWTDETKAYDVEFPPVTFAYSVALEPLDPSVVLEFSHSSISCDAIRVWFDVDTAGDPEDATFYVHAYYSGGWQSVGAGITTYGEYVELSLGSVQDVTGIRITFGNDAAEPDAIGEIYDVAFGKAGAGIGVPVIRHHLRQQKIA